MVQITNFRKQLLERLWGNYDPFAGFPRAVYRSDLQGWNSQHEYLSTSIEELRPVLVVEIGVWKGASSIFMGSKMKSLGLDAALVSIDTWLGSVEHWLNDDWRRSLGFEFGRPMVMATFMNNVLEAMLEDMIIPLPLDSLNAAQLLKERVIIDMIHLDGGHDFKSVVSDLETWWPLLRSGGILIGDDYNHDGLWPEVRRAFDEFFGAIGLAGFEYHANKCRIRKPA